MKKMIGLIVGFTLVFSLMVLSAASAADVIKIGHMRPLTGPMAQTSQEMVRSFNWAFERVGYEVAGKKIEIILGDSEANAEKAIDVARKMVEKDKVALVVGPIQGGEVMPVAAYMNRAGIPHLVTTQEPPPVVLQKMKWTISSGGTEPQGPSPMGVYAYEKAGFRKIVAISGDFTPGHGFLGAFIDAFKKKGGEVVQEVYTPYPTQDFGPYLTALKDADAVVAWLDGDQAIKLLTQYHEFGIDKRMPIVGATWGAFLAPYILGALPPEAADATIGYLTPTAYSPLLETPFNKQWVADFKAKFHFTPEDTSAGAYQGAMCVIEALKATGGNTSPEKLRQALLAVKFESPFGQVSFDPETGVRNMDMHISEVVKQDGEYLWRPIYTYKNVPALGY
jgi:branched-chain amino acid transport system substrate-binding protein